MSQPAQDKATSDPRRLLKAIVLVAAVFAVYWPAVHGQWLWDDFSEVTTNTTIKDAHGLWAMWFSPPGPDYFPVKSTLQWLEWHLWGRDPTGYHVVSFLLHSISALLLWKLLAKINVPFAWTAAFLFAVHPLCVESVAWVAEQKNTASLPLVLLALIAFTSYVESGAKRCRTLALMFFVLSLLAKTSGVGIPVVLVIYIFWKKGRLEKQDGIAVAPFFVASLVLGLVTMWFQRTLSIGSAVLPIGPLPERFAQAGHAIFFYASKCLVPVGLMAAYPSWDLGHAFFVDFWPWAIVVSLVVTSWAFRKTGVFLGLSFFLITLLPILGIIPLSWSRISPVSDHFAYLPLAAVVALVAAGAGWANQRIPAGMRLLIPSLLLAGLLGFAAQSHALAAHYKSPDLFWAEASRANPRSYVAHYNYGNALRTLGRNAEAAGAFEASIRENPTFALAYSNLGDVRAQQGQLEEAAKDYNDALTVDPGLVFTELKLGKTLMALSRYREAADADRIALRLDPSNPTLEYDLGVALLRSGAMPSEAVPYFEGAATLDPKDPQTLSTLGVLRAQLGQLEIALTLCARAVQIDPSNARFRNNYGNCLLVAERYTEAMNQYKEALRLDPGLTEAETNLEMAQAKANR